MDDDTCNGDNTGMDDITGMSDTEHERVAQSGERKCAEHNGEILKAVGLEGRIGRWGCI
jgi:hypothetical protein